MQYSAKEFLEKCEDTGGSLIHGFLYGLCSEDLDDEDLAFKLLVEKAHISYCTLCFQIEFIENKYEKLFEDVFG
jgi:hypothetical protein